MSRSNVIYSVLGVALLLLATLIVFEARKDKQTTLKLAHSLNSDHPVHLALVKMAERLDELSDGSMKLDIYLNGQLGSERELIEMLQIGSVSMTKVSAISLEGFTEEMRVFSVPYLFNDRQHYWDVLNSDIGKHLLNQLRKVHLQGLGYYDAGSRSFYMTDKLVEHPRDLISKKVRVLPSRTSIEMVQALGGSATPIAWGELYTALQQGVVDGAENNPPSYYLSKHYETAKYYTLDEHTSVPDILLMSRSVYDALSTQQRLWLDIAIKDSIKYQRELWLQAERDALVALKNEGVQIIKPNKAPFKAAVKNIQSEFLNGPLAELIIKINERGSYDN